MFPSSYSEDINGPLTEMPEDLLEFCRTQKMSNYNITGLAGMLFYIALLEQPKRILEIGTGWCLSTVALAAAARTNGGKVLSFDSHNRSEILSRVPELNPYIVQVIANSHAAGTCRELMIGHGFEEIDLLFIDGDHTYAGVKQDFEFFTQFLVKDGIVLMHDIALMDPGKGKDSVEVYQFWPEIDSAKWDKFPMYASNGLGIARKKS